VSFGHELAVTPLQLASGYAALVNGGLLVRPRLVKAVETAEGALLREFPRAPPERVVSEATSLWVRRTLARAVSEGTGRAVARLMRRGAQSSSVRVGGKTGTAMKYERDPETGEIRVSATRAVASFAGFAPAEAPALLCVVVWDEPEGARSGGLAAAPVVARILERVFVEMHGMADTSPRRHGGTEDSRSTPP
jgi:cell division protein FtsI/penicillin-binding protein 2